MTITLKNGDRFIDHFHERSKKYIFLRERGKILKANVRAFTIYKPRPNL